MNIRKVIFSFIVLTFLYGTSLFFLDIDNNTVSNFQSALQFLPFLMVLTTISIFLRYIRWYWLLLFAGYSTPFGRGFLFYVSGFALTATPGKIGELLRIRYFQKVNVPPSLTVSAFFFERSCDLLTVLMLGSFAAATFDIFPILAAIILTIVCLILALARYPFYLRVGIYFLRRLKFRQLALYSRVLLKGLSGTYRWVEPQSLLIAFLLGGIAWLILSISFIWLLSTTNTNASLLQAISVYPIAMLAGAISMLPGGVGSTEATIIMQLNYYGASLTKAGIIAVSIRIATIWFAILCGLLAIVFLENEK